MTFQESDLQFEFAPSYWQVMKYDTHKYYKTLSGAGLKGVDFIGIYQQKQLVFFEIKNYRTYLATKNPSLLLFEDTELFVQNMQDKFEDTITAIKVIIKYLNRKFWYRSFLKIEKYIPTGLFKNQDWYFWHHIHCLYTSSTTTTFVLWLEIDSKYSVKANDSFRKGLQKRLTEVFKNADIRPILAHLKQPVFKDTLKVKKGT